MGILLDFTKMKEQANKIEKLKEKYGDEKILVVKADRLPDSLKKQGVIKCNERVLSFLLDECTVMPRYIAEHNPAYKQPIPYVVIRNKGSYFTTKRLAGSGEKRLVNKISLGVGGHVNPEDAKDGYNSSLFKNAVYRELAEELYIPTCNMDIDFVGFINDTTDSVGNDHIGLLYIADIEFDNPDEEIIINEYDKLDGALVTLEGLKNIYKMLENWSKIVYDEVLSSWGIDSSTAI